jgi:YbbR domain-containing protein
MTTIVFEDVPIEVINVEVIENTGKTFEITSDKVVDVKITDNRTKVDKIKKEDIKVIADLKKLSYVNAVLLDGYVEGSSTTTVEFVNDNTITLELDSIVSKEIPIEVQKFCADDTVSYVPILTPEVNTVTISGGKTRIDTIDKIVYCYDVTNAVGVYEDSAEPIVYDRNGEELSNDLFTFNVFKVKASGTSYPVREVPINVTMTSEYIDGFKVGELTFEPQTLKVAGDSNSLDKLKVVDIRLDTNIDISGMKNNEFVKSVDASDYLPNGVYFVGQEDDVLLTLKFEALKVKTLTFNRSDVELRGLNNNYKAIIEDEIFSITVSGEEEILNSITKDSVKPYIDLEALSKGKYNMIVQFNGLDNVILTSNITVKLKIDSKE